MTAPTPEQQDAALASLAGNLTSARPEGDLERAMLRVALVAQAQARGATWAQIGAGLGMDGKAAKRHMKQVAAWANRELLASQAPEPQAPREPYVHVHRLPETEEEMAAAPSAPSFSVTRAG